MPAKKNTAAHEYCITGYSTKETKLIAAAFVSSIGPDKYDYALFAKFSGFTEATIKKFWPPVKKKVMEEVPNFGTFLNGGSVAASTFKFASNKKRKVAGADTNGDLERESNSAGTADSKTIDSRPQKAPAKGKGRGKKIRSEELEDDVMSSESSPDGENNMANLSKKRR